MKYAHLKAERRILMLQETGKKDRIIYENTSYVHRRYKWLDSRYFITKHLLFIDHWNVKRNIFLELPVRPSWTKPTNGLMWPYLKLRLNSSLLWNKIASVVRFH